MQGLWVRGRVAHVRDLDLLPVQEFVTVGHGRAGVRERAIEEDDARHRRLGAGGRHRLDETTDNLQRRTGHLVEHVHVGDDLLDGGGEGGGGGFDASQSLRPDIEVFGLVVAERLMRDALAVGGDKPLRHRTGGLPTE